jgi:hypothetical protein
MRYFYSHKTTCSRIILSLWKIVQMAGFVGFFDSAHVGLSQGCLTLSSLFFLPNLLTWSFEYEFDFGALPSLNMPINVVENQKELRFEQRLDDALQQGQQHLPAETPCFKTITTTTEANHAKITAAPEARLVKKQVQTPIGWFNAGIFSGTTSWSIYGCGSGFTITSSSNYFKCCPTTGVCRLYTGCSNNYILSGTTSTNWYVGSICN